MPKSFETRQPRARKALRPTGTIVIPGTSIATTDFLRGHGTFLSGTELCSSVIGTVSRVNKLIQVVPKSSRFNGEIGDVVVGRILEVGAKKWKVDIRARQNALLLLAAINLPGGVQRRKTTEDEQEMRQFFTEGDMVSAEVQAFYGDGSTSLQTRNVKYGKLRNGCLVIVQSALVKRAKSQFVELKCGIDLVLGLNGYIWVSKHTENRGDSASLYSNQNDVVTDQERQDISRISNVISALQDYKIEITAEMIEVMYLASLDFSLEDLLSDETKEKVIIHAKASLSDQ